MGILQTRNKDLLRLDAGKFNAGIHRESQILAFRPVLAPLLGLHPVPYAATVTNPKEYREDNYFHSRLPAIPYCSPTSSFCSSSTYGPRTPEPFSSPSPTMSANSDSFAVDADMSDDEKSHSSTDPRMKINFIIGKELIISRQSHNPCSSSSAIATRMTRSAKESSPSSTKKETGATVEDKHNNVPYHEFMVNFLRYMKDDLSANNLSWNVINQEFNEFVKGWEANQTVKPSWSGPKTTEACINSRYYRDNVVPRRDCYGKLAMWFDPCKDNGDGEQRGGMVCVMRKFVVRRRDDPDAILWKDYINFVDRCPEEAASEKPEYSWVRPEHKARARALGKLFSFSFS